MALLKKEYKIKENDIINLIKLCKELKKEEILNKEKNTKDESNKSTGYNKKF